MLFDGITLISSSTPQMVIVPAGASLPIEANALGELFYQPGVGLVISDGATWVHPGLTSIGPQGIPGQVGPQGIPGFPGIAGGPGAEGPRGITGEAGKDGIDGVQGLRGFTGLTGGQGPEGPTGPAGKDGIDGAQGLRGFTGLTGGQGPEGPVGKDGAPGRQGVRGIQGQSGPACTCNNPFSILNWRGATVDATVTEIFLVDDNQRVVVQPKSVSVFKLVAVARDDINDVVAVWGITGAIKASSANTATLVGSPVVDVISKDADAGDWGISVSIEIGENSLIVSVSGVDKTEISWDVTGHISEFKC